MTDRQCKAPLSEQLLLDFLENRLSQQEVQGVESHLDACQRCASSLNHAAGDQALWSLVGELSDDEIDDQWRSYDSSRTSLSYSTEQTEQDSQQHVRRKATLELIRPLLNSSDDPRSEGRIGNYEVLGLIGSGGMGIVVKARDVSLDRVVAIKILAPHLAAFESSRRRFEREAKSAAAVKHEGIIPIYGVDSHAGIPYLVMPYEVGPSLAQRIANSGRLSVEESLSVAAQLAESLAAAHRSGLVHRDIKPSNILLAPGTERALLMDFGLALATEEQAITMTGMLTGTPLYMSPEQARGEEVDGRSDLFSLGTVLFAMLTGETVAKPGNGYSIVRFIGSEPMPSIRTIDPSLPAWLDAFVGRLHEVDVDARVQSADDVAELANGCLVHLRNPKQHPLPAALEFANKDKTNQRSILWSIACLVILVCTVPFLVSPMLHTHMPPSTSFKTENSSESEGLPSDISLLDDGLDIEIEYIARAMDEIEQSDLEFERQELRDEN